jgi:hypothetical protein
VSRYITALPTEQDRVANSDFHMTLDEIGQELGVTRERVRQIQNTALDKLRREFPAMLFLMREMAIELRNNRPDYAASVIQHAPYRFVNVVHEGHGGY